MSGKGDRPRPGVYSQEFRDNFDRIFGARKKGSLPCNKDKDDSKKKDKDE